MPLWLWIALGAGGLYLWSKSSSPAPQVGMGTSAGIPGAGSVPGTGMVNLTSNFYRVGQSVNLPAGSNMFTDSTLSTDAGSFSGGTVTITNVVANATGGNSIGFVGPSGQGQGGGVPFWVDSSAVSAV